MGNPTPVFGACGVRLVATPRILQEKHLKLRVGNGQRARLTRSAGAGRREPRRLQQASRWTWPSPSNKITIRTWPVCNLSSRILWQPAEWGIRGSPRTRPGAGPAPKMADRLGGDGYFRDRTGRRPHLLGQFESPDPASANSPQSRSGCEPTTFRLHVHALRPGPRRSSLSMPPGRCLTRRAKSTILEDVMVEIYGRKGDSGDILRTHRCEYNPQSGDFLSLRARRD